MAFESTAKIQLVDGPTEASKTIIINDEDHTLGNALRFMMMRESQTSFCGYSMPHPSETRVQMRVQTRGEPAVEVTGRALGKLATAADTIRERFTAAVAAKAAAEGSSSSSA
ncbi:hypothetical protein FNF29_05441 [Cafeteria roenbergensis]|uniref:DNA-directed RNA polymerase RBP11-like dimerisation domain-containing protein n=1 Tax=Cafeteria roenbergensis TaxID=33653 RepID=A0A5A8CEF9_CAFRO|nr:hypothetical protein FNF29_05441 [Cafeteria roenbergensis]|eukprot:KAA0150201.1 hypothetical protein FNF29_05441 [Cafeteria roenbergensis]